MSIKEEIYIQLLNEGTPVWRPILGERLNNLVFKILPIDNYALHDEEWEFKPGEIVRCKRVMKNNKENLIAVEKVNKDYEEN